MSERDREWQPIHLMRCGTELLGMYAMELYRRAADAMEDALDVDFGNDDD